jgi:hypothetical protein
MGRPFGFAAENLIVAPIHLNVNRRDRAAISRLVFSRGAASFFAALGRLLARLFSGLTKRQRKEKVMRAIRFEAFGDPSVLEAVEVPAPIADEKSAVPVLLLVRRCPQGCLNLHDFLSELSLPVRSCRSQSSADLWTKTWIARWAS